MENMYRIVKRQYFCKMASTPSNYQFFQQRNFDTYHCQIMTNDASLCTQDNQVSYGVPDSTRGLVDIYQGASERAAYIDTAIVSHEAKPVWAVWGPTEPTCKIHNCEQQKNQKVDEDKIIQSWKLTRWCIIIKFSKVCILKKIAKF